MANQRTDLQKSLDVIKEQHRILTNLNIGWRWLRNFCIMLFALFIIHFYDLALRISVPGFANTLTVIIFEMWLILIFLFTLIMAIGEKKGVKLI